VSVGGDHGGQRERGESAATARRASSERDAATAGRIPAGAEAAGSSGPPQARSRPGPGRRLADIRRAPDAAAESVPRQLHAARVDADFREFVSARGRALLRSAYLLTGNQADAEDLVQSALAKTYQAWDRIEDRNALDGYVRRAMVNTQISWWRRRRVDEYPTDEIPDQPAADTSGNSELHDTLQRAIDRLPQRMRAAVVLRYFEDMTEAEVADILGVSQGTVKSTVSRAVAKLRTDADLLAE
jgi:RNA polymerase sigma-70 factor (sigma-E family)